MPTKQHSTVSSFSSRRSSLVAGAGAGAGAGTSVPALSTGQARRLSADKQPRTFSTIREKAKIKNKKKKKKLKMLNKKKSISKREIKVVSDKDEDDEEYESEPDVSEIVLFKPKVEIKLENMEMDQENTAVETTALKQIVIRKKRRKCGRKSKKKLRRSKMILTDPAAAELERLLAEKDRLLKEELAKLDPEKAPSKPDSSFFPAPKNLEKRRCYFHRGAKALKCTVCSGGDLCFETSKRVKLNVYVFQFITGQEELSSQTLEFWPR